MILLKYIFLYFIILLGSIFIADKLKDKLQNTIVIYLMASIFFIYIFGILNILNIGIFIVSLSSILLGIITIVKFIKNKNKKQLWEIVATPGTIFFTVIFLVFIITTINRTIIHWDQYSYWSYAIKDMYFTGKINIQNSIGIQYPPMPAILQVFFMKIIGTYSQGIEIFTTWIFGISLLIPLFEKTNNKKICNIAIGTMVLCIPAVFGMIIFYESAYPDALLGLLIGYMLMLYFLEKNKKIRNIALILSIFVTTITKPTGFVIAGIITLTFLIYEIFKRKSKFIEFVKRKEIQKIAIYMLIIILTYTSYNIYIKLSSMNSEEQTNNNKSNIASYIIGNILTTTIGISQENDYSAAYSNQNLLSKMQTTMEIYTPIYISALGVIFIYVITAIFIYKYSKEDDKNISKTNVKHMYTAIFIGLILYILFLQTAYIVKFSSEEMINHDGFERYIGSYLLGILYFLVFTILEKIKNRTINNNLPYVILSVIILTFTPINQISNATITSGIYNINNKAYLSKSSKNAEYIKEKVNKEDKVLGICQSTDIERLENLIIRYYMYPINYKVIDKIEKSTGELSEIIKDYNYIYIVYSDSYLEYAAKQYLNGEETIKENTLYKVNIENQTIKLEKINN